jgi:glycosyltransferase involved in cell wall biosynthesis
MRISFNLINTGLNNNGGSLTLIESDNILQELGCDVTIVDGGKNLNMWNPIKCKHLIIKDLKDFPISDIVIATGMGSLKSTDELNISKKYHWIRGFEKWVTPEENIIKSMKNSKTKKIVNSICLKRKLEKHGIQSEIIRPGHNFNDFKPLGLREKNQKVTIGGLFNQGTKRAQKRTEWIFDCYNFLKNKYDLSLIMFGADGIPNVDDNSIFIKNPEPNVKEKLYNMIDIWLSPSQLEGLHIAPQEAMLTECCVVGNNSEMSGTEDYLIDHETGLVSENNFKSFLSNVEILVKHKVLRTELGKKGREKILSLGNREENMKRMIELLKD